MKKKKLKKNNFKRFWKNNRLKSNENEFIIKFVNLICQLM